MRILHFADIHIGVENFGKVHPQTGLSTRLMDFLDTFDEVVSYALDNHVDLVLFAGDAYKSRDPSQTHQREFAKRVARLSNAGIPVFLLVGNHDTPHVIGRATSLEIFNTLDVSNVHIGDSLKTHRIDTPGGPIQIVALPWIRRSSFLTRDETRGFTPDQVNEAIQEGLSRIIRAEAEKLDNSIPAVLAGHVTVSQSETSSEVSMMLGRDHVLLKSDVALPEFDYVALGHIHKHQILNHNPLVVYSGSVQRIDFGEERDEKGFCVVDFDTSKPAGLRKENFEFHTVNARRFLTISAKLGPDDPDPTSTVIRSIEMHHIQGAIVRLNISMPSGMEGHLNDSEIRKALEPAHFVASISKDVVGQPRARLGQSYSKALDPREAFNLYLESRNVSADRAKILIEHAEKLMADTPS